MTNTVHSSFDSDRPSLEYRLDWRLYESGLNCPRYQQRHPETRRRISPPLPRHISHPRADCLPMERRPARVWVTAYCARDQTHRRITG